MAKKTDAVSEIKKLLAGKKLIFGSKRTLKLLKAGKISKIFAASNCAESIKNALLHYSGISKVEVVDIPQDNEELGVLCKRKHLVSVIGVR